MIEIKEAVSRSFEALKEMALAPPTAPIELEEAELENDGNFWVVTFSYPNPDQAVDSATVGPNLRAILRNRRIYKAIRLGAADGTIRGIKSVHV